MKRFFDHKLVLESLRGAAVTARTGAREEKSGKFLPPPGWKGRLVTATDDGLTRPGKGEAA